MCVAITLTGTKTFTITEIKQYWTQFSFWREINVEGTLC